MTKSKLFTLAHTMTKAVLQAGDDYQVTFGQCVTEIKNGFSLTIKKAVKIMGTTIYAVTGKTFERKAKIKIAGGKWDANSKSWMVELYLGDSLFRYEGSDDLIFTAINNKQLSKEKAYDNLYNEGAEGFNPYR